MSAAVDDRGFEGDPSRPPAVCVRGLHKSFGARKVLCGVDFEVHAGETFGLLGPNGAGKTTLMSVLLGVLRPDAGGVVLAGSSDPTRPAVRARVGIAPQELAIYPRLSARENVQFFGKLYGLRADGLERRVEEALRFCDLWARRDDRAGTWSGGMQRRLNLACGLVHGPDVLLLDEPTVGVDPHARAALLDKIAQLRHLGTTVLYTTHALEEAQKICTRVALLHRGHVIACERIEALCARLRVRTLEEAFFALTNEGAQLQ